jgi:hypothetical protein
VIAKGRCPGQQQFGASSLIEPEFVEPYMMSWSLPGTCCSFSDGLLLLRVDSVVIQAVRETLMRTRRGKSVL